MKFTTNNLKTRSRHFELTWYQRYYRLLALFRHRRLSKYDSYGNKTSKKLEYHHVCPVSIYGNDKNLIVVVPGNVHAKLHWILWHHYLDKHMASEAAKMRYAWETLDKKYGTSTIDETYGIGSFFSEIKNDYAYLIKNYSI